MGVGTPHAGSLRVPGPRQSSQGQSGPKPRPPRGGAWAMESRVDSPAPAATSRGGDAAASAGRPHRMDGAGRAAEDGAQANPGPARVRGGPGAGEEPAEAAPWAGRPEKPLGDRVARRPYRTPTPVGSGEYREADERSPVKELGK